MAKTLMQKRLATAGVGAIFRPRDVDGMGLPFRKLRQLVDAGEVEQVGPGLYRLVAAEPSEFEALAMVASAVPNAIVCLLSALRFHDLGTQSPHEVWIALDRKARRPTRIPTSVRIVRFSGPMLVHGVVRHEILGVQVRITSPARTVVDCFRYRGKIGIDVATEALRDLMRRRKATISEVVRAAEACRAITVVRPYLEAMAT